MRQMQVADLTASANEIDNRMGPIPGRSSDRIANELRWAADELQRALDMLGDIPGQSLTERLQTYIGHYMALQLKVSPQVADQAETAEFYAAQQAAVGAAESAPPSSVSVPNTDASPGFAGAMPDAARTTAAAAPFPAVERAYPAPPAGRSREDGGGMP